MELAANVLLIGVLLTWRYFDPESNSLNVTDPGCNLATK
jgi:hypothetical protein